MKLHHLGIAVKNLEVSTFEFSNSLGWQVRSEKVFDPIQNVNVLFMGDENNTLYELIEPVNESSPIINILNKRISLYHICYLVADIDVSISSLSKTGFIVVSGPSKAAAFNFRRIAFLINKDNFTIELLEE